MNAKSITRIVLLGVVAFAVGAWAMKEFGPGKSVASATGDKGPAGVSITRPDGVTVINFHGAKRCRTCIGIGDLARKTLDDEFKAEEQAGKVRWEHINYDDPANAHFVKDYGLVSSTVLVTLWNDGKEVKWNRLDGVWDHVDDEPAFRAYVARGVRGLLDP
jgi:hypothetical protein